MSALNALNCCGIKEFAQIQTHFMDYTTGVKSTVRECALDALDFLLRQWATAEFESVPHPEGHYNIDYNPGQYVPRTVSKTVGVQFIPRAAHIVFSDHGILHKGSEKVEFGKAFADLITELNLGTVVQTEPKKNPNSGNTVTVFVWSMDVDAIKEYANKQEFDGIKIGALSGLQYGYPKIVIDEFAVLYDRQCKGTPWSREHIDYDRSYAARRQALMRHKDREAGKPVPPLEELQSKEEPKVEATVSETPVGKPVEVKKGTAMAVGLYDRKEEKSQRYVHAYGAKRPFRAARAAKTGRLD